MKKAMYSLMLSEKVVEEIDRLAEKEGTNRSNLVNQILAEYVSVITPEKRISDIFDKIESLFITKITTTLCLLKARCLLSTARL